MFQPFLGSVARHMLTTAAGCLVTYGVLQSSQVEAFVSACLLFAGLAWSCWQKVNTPEMLAWLAERLKEKAHKRMMAAVIGGFAVFSMLIPHPAGAQTLFSPLYNAPAPKAKKQRARPMPQPMKAGLLGLLPTASPLDQLFGDLQKASIVDLEYAKALADGVKDSPQAAARARCYGAWLSMLAATTSAQAAIEGAPAPERPGLAHLFTRFEQMSQVADSLAPLSQFQIACAPVAQAMRMNIVQFVSSVIGGGLSLGKLGILP